MKHLSLGAQKILHAKDIVGVLGIKGCLVIAPPVRLACSKSVGLNYMDSAAMLCSNHYMNNCKTCTLPLENAMSSGTCTCTCLNAIQCTNTFLLPACNLLSFIHSTVYTSLHALYHIEAHAAQRGLHAVVVVCVCVCVRVYVCPQPNP